MYNSGMDAADPLELFLPPVQRWFRATLGEPTPPQRLGWPAIAAGQNTLILAPTGSGKTLAAFLACLDALWRQPAVAARRARALHLAAQGAQQRHPSQPASAPRRRRGDGAGHGLATAGAGGRRPHRRHAHRRAPAPDPPAAARPHHHAGIAAPAADLARPRDAARRHALHRR